MFLEVGPGREGQEEDTGTALGNGASYGDPDYSLQSTGAQSAAGLGLSQCDAFCYAWGTVSGDGGLAYRPLLRTEEAKDLKKAQAMVKCRWVKNGLEYGWRGQDRVEKEAWR